LQEEKPGKILKSAFLSHFGEKMNQKRHLPQKFPVLMSFIASKNGIKPTGKLEIKHLTRAY
jgi:hypothetical protein